MNYEAQLKALEEERQKEIRERKALEKENAQLRSLVEILNRHKANIQKIKNETNR